MRVMNLGALYPSEGSGRIPGKIRGGGEDFKYKAGGKFMNTLPKGDLAEAKT